MIIFRILSLVIIAAALMFLGADVVSYLEDDTVSLRSFVDVVSLVSSDLSADMLAWKDGLPDAARPVIGAIYSAPAWLPLGIIGILLAFLFRERD